MTKTKKKETVAKKQKDTPQKQYSVPRQINAPKFVLDGMNQTDGKDWSAPKARPRTMEELWGGRGSKFGTVDEDEYRGKLAVMNKADLQQACIKIGLMPHDSRQTMIERLLKQFRIHVAGIKGVHTTVKTVPKLTEASEKLRRWMQTAGGNTLI